MKLDAYLPLTGRRISTLGLAALVSCFMLVGTTEAVAKATTSKSLTQSQKLTKALKACKKQPKKKRAACVKQAKKKYATHHAIPPTAPTGPATPPTAPVTPPAGPAAGPVAPAGPTLAQVQQQLCSRQCTHAQILNVNILERGVPRLGTGVSTQRGGDNVPSDTWIFPLLVGYDEAQQIGHYSYCPPFEVGCKIVWVPETETYHWTETESADLAANGVWSFYFVHASATCEPPIAACPS
jgi:hypothetical protein